MPIQSKDVLKSYFETGDRPTQQEFTDLIDSMTLVNSAGSAVMMDCVSTITQADQYKAVMINSIGKLELYARTPAVTGQAGRWELTLNQLTGVNQHALEYYNSGDGSYFFSNTEWVPDPANPPVTVADEAALIRDYINANLGTYLVASLTGTVITITELTANGGDFYISNDPDASFSLATTITPIQAIPERCDKAFIGFIDQVDETANQCSVFAPGIVKAIAGETINISPTLALDNGDYQYMLVLPADGGTIKVATEAQWEDYERNIAGAIGFVLSNGAAGEQVIVKMIK